MADATFTPGYKFIINFCMKTDCKNKDKQCKLCVRYSEYIKNENTSSERHS